MSAKILVATTLSNSHFRQRIITVVAIANQQRCAANIFQNAQYKTQIMLVIQLEIYAVRTALSENRTNRLTNTLLEFVKPQFVEH